MNTKIQKWGNSLAIRIPKSFAETVELNEGNEVKLRLVENKIIVEKEEKRKKYTLNLLLSNISEDNIHKEIDTGQVTGKEIW